MNFDNLSLDEKIGQRFILGVNSSRIDIIIKLIREKHIGGVILYKRNYKTYNEMIEVIKKLKLANKDNKIPLFIAIDQEGGVVNRLPEEIHDLRNIHDISKNSTSDIKEYASIIGNILLSTGINMNFAPVVDIDNHSKSKALYKRCFSDNLEEVIKDATEYITKMKERNVISVIKHFPGHGATKRDSHFLLPYIFDYKKVIDYHMVPFNKLGSDIADAMMIGHIRVRKHAGFLPASINNGFISSYIVANGYKGLIISDEINMLKRHPIYRMIYLNKVLTSLNDIVLIKIKDINEGYSVIDKYKKMLDNDGERIKYLDNSVKKIIDIKNKYEINDDVSFKGVDIAKINEQIDKINMI